MPDPCPGDCNRAWRKAQAPDLVAWREALEEKRDRDGLTPAEGQLLRRLSIEPFAGEPVWCVACLDTIRRAIRRMPDMAVWLWDRGHDGAGVDIGRLSVVRAERGSGVKGSPSLSPSWDAVDELVSWAAAVEDKARARLGERARSGEWWQGTQQRRQLVLSTIVLWILARDEIWSMPEAEQWGKAALRLDKRDERLAGRDELVHHLGACPTCDRKALIRIDGEDVVTCRSCKRRWSEDEYQWLVRVAVTSATEMRGAK